MPLDPQKFKEALRHTENQKGNIAYQKECAACHHDFTTVKQWEKRCVPCREADKPYTKIVYSPTESPF